MHFLVSRHLLTLSATLLLLLFLLTPATTVHANILQVWANNGACTPGDSPDISILVSGKGCALIKPAVVNVTLGTSVSIIECNIGGTYTAYNYQSQDCSGTPAISTKLSNVCNVAGTSASMVTCSAFAQFATLSVYALLALLGVNQLFQRFL